jgi:hypothetical protein
MFDISNVVTKIKCPQGQLPDVAQPAAYYDRKVKFRAKSSSLCNSDNKTLIFPDIEAT